MIAAPELDELRIDYSVRDANDIYDLCQEVWATHPKDEEARNEMGWNLLRQVYPDEREFCEMFFRIRPKKPGRLILMKDNKGQRIFNKVWDDQEAAGKPVRIIILKARQIGFSTKTQQKLAWRVLTRPNVRAAVIAHDTKPAQEIFEMTSRFIENLPFAPRLDTSRRDEIQAAGGSKYTVYTAGSPAVSRGISAHQVHLSEFAFYADPDSVYDALMQAIADEPGTAIVIESTANGMTNLYYDLWKQAVAGENDFVPIFMPWWMHDEYRRDLTQKQALAIAENLKDEEKTLVRRFKLSVNQLAWRRHTIRNKCRNNPTLFRQEYPSSPEEAFLHSGQPVFDLAAVQEAREKTEPPRYRMELVWV